ncbi:hypothetical protein [Candidatus Oscillochloris fontis]|uniref:hypothetical protein n=1 Tax=Candidatus Oscillochloris fontis TaxID=2496868 RepID=UPI00101C04DC|nr:hypothetical protein [Candidatus Oscillochloris fontis]
MPPTRPVLIALSLGLVLLLSLCGLSGFLITRNPNGRHLSFDTPPIAGHVYSIWLLPCDAYNPGQIILGRDLMIYSRYPPPGFSIPLAPMCP